MHTPDLDDVFFALTGQPDGRPDARNGDRPMTTLSYAVRDSATMLRRNLRHVLRYPLMRRLPVGVPGPLPAAVRRRVRRTLAAGLAGRPPRGYIDYLVPGILAHDRRVRRLGHRAVGQPWT